MNVDNKNGIELFKERYIDNFDVKKIIKKLLRIENDFFDFVSIIDFVSSYGDRLIFVITDSEYVIRFEGQLIKIFEPYIEKETNNKEGEITLKDIIFNDNSIKIVFHIVETKEIEIKNKSDIKKIEKEIIKIIDKDYKDLLFKYFKRKYEEVKEFSEIASDEYWEKNKVVRK